MTQPGPLRITNLSAACTDGVSRVSADVDGRPLWFASSDAALEASAEGFASALLIPALAKGRRLEIDAPVCSQWHGHLDEITGVLHRWWGYPQVVPEMEVAVPTPPRSPGRTGLCFTGGADSFFSLLRAQDPIDVLVYVYDFDFHPKAPQRLPQFEPWLRRVARQSGSRAVVIRTNLKRHPALAGIPFMKTHGGALAAVGHVLSGEIGKLIISSSNPHSRNVPWGSHWELDELWASSRLDISHFGAVYSRPEKLQRIAHEWLVRKYLRPCWENIAGKLNCSVCEKCVRTQLALAICGALDDFPAFDQTEPLWTRIAAIHKLSNRPMIRVYEQYLKMGMPLRLEQAVEALIRRSHRSAAIKRFKQRVGGALLGRRRAA
jgi:hypothetical protein